MDISLYISKAKNSHDILLRFSTETNPDFITGNILVFFDEQNIVDMSDGCLEIPQFGTKHSLNVSVTVGIVVWEFAKLLKL